MFELARMEQRLIAIERDSKRDTTGHAVQTINHGRSGIHGKKTLLGEHHHVLRSIALVVLNEIMLMLVE